MRTARVVLALPMLLAGLSLADIVTTSDGRKYDGKIVEETAASVVIETKFGKFTLAKDKVKSIERIKSKADEYAEKAQALKADDPEAHYELGMWSKEQGYSEGFAKEMQAVLKLAPDHQKAHDALGHVQHEGKWVTKAERDALAKKKDEDEKRAQGLVPYKGKWVPKEEKENLEKGLVLHEGKWMSKEEKERIAKGLVQHEGRWVTKEEKENLEKGLFKVGGKWISKEKANEYHSEWENAWELKSDHYVVRSNCDYDRIMLFIHDAEITYKAMAEMLKMEPKTKGLNLYVFAVGDDMNAYNTGNQDTYLSHHSSSWGGTYVHNKEEKAAVTYLLPTDRFWTTAFIQHAVTEQFIAESGAKITAPWLVEGLAHYMVHFQFKPLPEISYYRGRVLDAGRLEPLPELIARTDLHVSGDRADEEANVVFFEQSALLVYFLSKSPKYAETWQKFLEEATKKGDEVALFKTHFKDLKAVHDDFVAFLRAGNPLASPQK